MEFNVSFSNTGMERYPEFSFPYKAHVSDAAYDLQAWPDLSTLMEYNVCKLIKNPLSAFAPNNIIYINGKEKKITDKYTLSNLQAVYLLPNTRLIIGAGFKLEMNLVNNNNFLPAAFVLPRSGLAANTGLSVANAPGLIDAGYRGEIKVALENRSSLTHIIPVGMRIAQLMFIPCFNPLEAIIKTELNSSDRGAAGFGSTGA